MKWAENVKNVVYGDKIVLANLANGTWVRTNIRSYKIICNIIESDQDIDRVKFEVESDRKYIQSIIESFHACKILLDREEKEDCMNKNVSIELTNRCNLNCIHCCVDAGMRSTDLPKEKIFTIIDKCIKWNPKMISLSGGEPLLRNDFWEILKYVRTNYNGNIAVSTNATLITNENAEILSLNADQIDI